VAPDAIQVGVMQSIIEKLDSYSDLLAPLREVARHYAASQSVISADGTLSIGHRAWIAPLSYSLELFPGIDVESLRFYSQRFKISVPEIYQEFLREINGAFCFGMSLCGVPLSMLGSPPLLDRSRLQCHDLATAATTWVAGYNVPERFFHFGGRHYSYTENVGYFIDSDNNILCVRTSGEVLSTWTSLTQFLADELKASEALFKKHNF